MNDAKYIGMDVHTATISAAVRVSSGKTEYRQTNGFDRGKHRRINALDGVASTV